MKQIFLLVLLFFTSPTFAQYGVDLEWVVKNQTNGNGGGAYKKAPMVIADKMGGVYYCGSTYHPGPSTGLLIIHYDADGNTLWKDTLDDTSVDELAGALIDKEGHLIVARNATSPFGFFGLSQIIKYSKTGTYIWEYLLYEQGVPWKLGDLKLDEEDNLYLMGGWSQPADSMQHGLATLKLNGENGDFIWKNEVIDSFGWYSVLQGRIMEDRIMLIAKKTAAQRTYVLHQFDLEGNTLQTVENDYPGEAEFNDWVHIDQNSNVYLGVNSWSYKTTKVDSFGDTIWTYERPYSEGMPVRNSVLSINSDFTGNIYCVGSYFTKDAHWALSITKIGTNGDVLWQKDYFSVLGQTDDAPIRAFIRDSLLFIFGTSYSSLNPDSLESDYLILAYSLDGEELFSQVLDDGFSYESASSGSYHQGDLFVAGYNDYPWPDERNDQYVFKYRLDDKTSLLIPQKENLQYQIFPNPIHDFLQINPPEDQKIYKLHIYNSNGEKLPFTRDGNRLWVSKLLPGAYWLEITSKNGNKEVHRLIKH